MSDRRPKIIFVTNICPHYRVRTFETLSKYVDAKFYFFSAGDEWYWQQQHGTRVGQFDFEYLPGWKIKGTRITPGLAPKLWSEDYDVLVKCITGKFALPASYVIARLRRKPFVLWTGIWMTLQSRLHRFIFPLTRYIYRHADAICVYGEHVKTYLVHQGVAPARIFVAHHAVDNSLYSQKVSQQRIMELRRELRIPENHSVILFLGRLEDCKGLEYLVEAFEKLVAQNITLLFVGEGSHLPITQAVLREKGLLDRARFKSYVAPEDTPPYYALASMLVLPSVTTELFREPWGLVVNEAMNQAVPVIASDAVGAAAGGLVEDGITGFIVPERDSSALANAIQQLLEDADLRAAMGRNALSKIADWNNEKMVLGFRNAIDFVLAKRRGHATAGN